MTNGLDTNRIGTSAETDRAQRLARPLGGTLFAALLVGCGPGLLSPGEGGSGTESAGSQDASSDDGVAGTGATMTGDATSTMTAPTTSGPFADGTSSSSESTEAEPEAEPPEWGILVTGDPASVHVDDGGVFINSIGEIAKHDLETGARIESFADEGVLGGSASDDPAAQFADLTLDGDALFTCAMTAVDDDVKGFLRRYDTQTGSLEFSVPLPDWARGAATVVVSQARVYTVDANANDEGEFVMLVHDATDGAYLDTFPTAFYEDQIFDLGLGARLATNGAILGLTLSPSGALGHRPHHANPAQIRVLTLDPLTGVPLERFDALQEVQLASDPAFWGSELLWNDSVTTHDGSGGIVLAPFVPDIPGDLHLAASTVLVGDALFTSGTTYDTESLETRWFITKRSLVTGALDPVFGEDGVVQGIGARRWMDAGAGGEALYTASRTSTAGLERVGMRIDRLSQLDGQPY